MPKKGQEVHWKALPGYVRGSVIEVVRTEKKIDGKAIKSLKDDPRIVLKSSSSGKIAVHKPEAVFSIKRILCWLLPCTEATCKLNTTLVCFKSSTQ